MAQFQIFVLAGIFTFFIGYIWGLILAFRTSVWWGLAFLFLPLGWPIFLLAHFRQSLRAIALIVCGAGLVVLGVARAPQPGQLTTMQAQKRRAEVATIEQQRQARMAKLQAELQESRTQAQQRYAELTKKRTSTKPDDKEAVSTFNHEVIEYNGLLQRIKILETALQNAYYATPAPANSARRTPAEKAALPYADEDLLELQAEPINVRNRLSDKTDPLLAAGNFAELDKIAAQLRTSKIECANGVWHLRSFYDGFAMLPDYLPESAWTDRIAVFQKWIQQSPNSITPRVGLAGVWCEWAWRARGGNYANDVPGKGWDLFKQRLGEASKVLGDARNLNEKCPVWWDVAQRIALGQSWNRKDYDQLFNQAIRFEPRYTGFYTNKNNYLLPRWFGKDGDCAAFAEEAANRLGGDDGDVLYARLVWRLHSMDIFPNGSIVDGARASWPRVSKGLETILKRQPDSIAAASELCYLCCQHGERDRMRQLFVQIGPFVDTTVYGDNRRFLEDRRVAFQQ